VITVCPTSPTPDHAAPTFLSSLLTGRLDWSGFQPFPQPGPGEQDAGDGAVTGIEALLDEQIDPEEIDRTGSLPDGLLGALHGGGFLGLRRGPADGGRDLSAYNTFRVVSAAAGRSVAVGQLLGIHNGIGVATVMLPVSPPGGLRTAIEDKIAEGAVSGWADTEPTGQNNRWPRTTATRSADGASYVLSGEKLFIGNAPVAGLLGVTATTGEGADRRICLCVVDTRSPGFEITARCGFLGSRGLPVAGLRLDTVRVPADHVLTADDAGDPRYTPQMGATLMQARSLITAAPATAIARLCLRYSRAFVARRTIDGRNLGEYDEVQRIVAATLADVFALDSVVRWSLLAPGHTDRFYERLALKNICTTASWRTVDRTMSLLGGEGLETPHSKRARGADPLPLERLFRDARGLRTTSGVDFQIDNQTARFLLSRFAELGGRAAGLAGAGSGAEAEAGELLALTAEESGLSPANHAQLTATARQLHAFARTCRELAGRYPDPEELFAREHTLILLSRIASELLTMCAVLARTAGWPGTQQLAEVYCTAARHRLAGLWRRLPAADEPDYAKVSRDWLAGPAGPAGSGLDILLRH
jgi:alkylation response protein AidB-like acyl-CoA dehydrogenase